MIEVTIKGKKRVFDSEEDYKLFKEISEKLEYHFRSEKGADYNLDDYINEQIRRLVEETHILFGNMYLYGIKYTEFFNKEFSKAF
jgi:hypothetical protein